MNRHGILSMAAAGVLAALAAPSGIATAHELHPAKVEGHVGAVARMLEANPELVIDFSAKSGEYCMNTWKVGGSHMTHYAVDPSKTVEDVIDFVKVDELAGAIDVEKLPKLPEGLGAMQPGQWYYLPPGAYDPHHQTRFPFPLLVRATNVQ